LFEVIFDMDTEFTSLVDKTCFVHFAAKPNKLKYEDELPRECFGSMPLLGVVKDLTFNAKPFSLSLAQLSLSCAWRLAS